MEVVPKKPFLFLEKNMIKLLYNDDELEKKNQQLKKIK